MSRAFGNGKRPVALAALATAVAPFLAYAVVRSSAHEATGFRTDFDGALPPPSLWPEVRSVMKTARAPRAKVPAEALETARRAAVAYPLSFEPYFLAARVAEGDGRYGEAIALMEEARRRRPNYTATRVQLLNYYSLENAYQQAIDEADVAMRVNPRTATHILPAFAKLIAGDAKARRAIAVALSRSPSWEPDFLNVAANSGMRPGDGIALIEDVRRASKGRRDSLREQDQFLVRLLVNAREYARARQHWRETLARPGEGDGLVVDPQFARGSEPPFGWRLNATAEGVAERSRGTSSEPASLSVSFFGSAAATLAEQVLVLPPGQYRLLSRSRLDGGGDDAGLFWRLHCAPTGAGLASLQLRPSEGERTWGGLFTVPAGCPAQRITLAGVPGDIPRTMSGQILSVQIERVGGRGAR